MKAVLWVGLIILIFVCLGVGYYIWDNNPSVIRGRVEKAYYNEYSHEGCESENVRVFPSKLDCLNAVACLSKEVAKNIRDQDLGDFNKKIKSKESIESKVSTYFGNNFGKDCLTSNGWNEGLRN